MYEDFVPWCQRSRVLRRYENGSFDAELEIGFKFLVESYISHVEREKPKYIKVICLFIFQLLKFKMASTKSNGYQLICLFEKRGIISPELDVLLDFIKPQTNFTIDP
jgi:Polyketide cyclase / dehydrase and lipid transport